MVDQSDLQKIGLLNDEYKNIAQALTTFDAGGRITSMAIATPPEGPEPRIFTTITTDTMDYPQQMVEAIKHALEERQHEIAEELSNMGITGIASLER